MQSVFREQRFSARFSLKSMTIEFRVTGFVPRVAGVVSPVADFRNEVELVEGGSIGAAWLPS